MNNARRVGELARRWQPGQLLLDVQTKEVAAEKRYSQTARAPTAKLR